MDIFGWNIQKFPNYFLSAGFGKTGSLALSEKELLRITS